MRSRRFTPRLAAACSLAFVLLWATAAWLAHLLDWRDLSSVIRLWGGILTYLLGLAWCVWAAERGANRFRRARAGNSDRPGGGAWNPLNPQAKWYSSLAIAIYCLLLFVPLFPYRLCADVLSDLFSGRNLRWLPGELRERRLFFWIFVVGFSASAAAIAWNLLKRADPNARAGAKLRPQSFTVMGGYSILFLLLLLLLSIGPVSGVVDDELPAGGGQEMIQQKVQIKKQIIKKLVINPYSSILFNPPPIEKFDPKLLEVTKNLYAVGQGSDGDTAGFSGGKGSGQIRFYRLKHSDKHWDRNFGVGGDMNMLTEYHIRTRHKIAEKPEYVEIAQLPLFSPTKAPPLLYVCGTSTFQVTPAEKKILREYLTQRHGMILADNCGGPGFHSSFLITMRDIMDRAEVTIPRDDAVHKVPYALPEFPFVVAHGGTAPLGWNVDGRWVVYYHPGALSDAWRDDHAGIKSDIWENCYRLGVNLIFYSRAAKNKWLEAQKQR